MTENSLLRLFPTFQLQFFRSHGRGARMCLLHILLKFFESLFDRFFMFQSCEYIASTSRTTAIWQIIAFKVRITTLNLFRDIILWI